MCTRAAGNINKVSVRVCCASGLSLHIIESAYAFVDVFIDTFCFGFGSAVRAGRRAAGCFSVSPEAYTETASGCVHQLAHLSAHYYGVDIVVESNHMEIYANGERTILSTLSDACVVYAVRKLSRMCRQARRRRA